MHIYSHQDKFIQNKYYRWYYSIIERALCQGRIKNKFTYYEAHHILPSSIFPEYKSFKTNQWNKVLLTAREHFICHLLLPKFVADKQSQFKVIHALYAMTQQNNNQQQRNNSKSYAYAKRLMIEIRKDPIASKDWRDKVSIANLGENNPRFGKPGTFLDKTHSQETKDIIGSKNRGLKRTQEVKDKLKGPRGKQKNPAPLLKCPHCGFLTKKGNIWHFDRCQSRLS